MSFVGNTQGPRKSEIVAKLGAEYFGISCEELLAEIEVYRDEEYHGEVDPVYVDREGRHFILFNAPGGGTQKFCLEENGYQLVGQIKEIPVEDRA